MTVPSTNPERDDFETRFASLEAASRSLSLDVRTLNETLQVVGALQKEQAETRRRQDEADRNLAIAKSEADARESRTRRTFGGVSLALAILLPVVSMVVYYSLIQHVDDLLAAQRANSFMSCTIRNEAAKANIQRELTLADLEDRAALKTVHRDSAQALRASLVDCSQFQRK